MQMLQGLFYTTIALHVSGIIIIHLQEHKTSVTTVFFNIHGTVHRSMTSSNNQQDAA